MTSAHLFLKSKRSPCPPCGWYRLLQVGLAFVLLTGTAGAQEVTEQALVPMVGAPLGQDIVAVSDTDVVVLLPPHQSSGMLLPGGGSQDTTVRLQRLGADLSPLWTTSVELTVSAERERGPVQNTVQVSWMKLVFIGERLVLFSLEDNRLMARSVDPETGTATEPEAIATLTETDEDKSLSSFLSNIVWVLEPVKAQTRLERQVGPVSLSPGQAWIAVVDRTETGGPRFRILDEDLQVVSTIDVESSDLVEASFRVGDDGSLVLLGRKTDDTHLYVQQYPLRERMRSVAIDLGGRVQQDVELAWGPSGTVHIVALTSGEKKKRVDTIQIIGVRNGRILYHQTYDRAAVDAVLETRGDGSVRGFGRSSIVRDLAKVPDDSSFQIIRSEIGPDGNLLVGLRAHWGVVEVKTTQSGTTRTTTVYYAGDALLMSHSPEGELRWARLAPIYMRSLAPYEMSLRTGFSDDALRMVYRDEYRTDAMTVPVLSIRDISLDDGTLGEPRDLIPDYGPGQVYCAPWSVELSSDEWLIVTRAITMFNPRAEDTTVISRIRLDMEPAAPREPAPATLVSHDHPDWKLGLVAGKTARMTNPWDDRLRGLAIGAAGTSAGWLTGLTLARNSDSSGMGLVGLGFTGSVVTARLVGGDPSPGWWTTQSPEYQASYVFVTQKAARKRAMRWSLLGSLGGTILTSVVYVAVASDQD